MGTQTYQISRHTRKGGGFSLIELVIVVVIIGIIGAIAIPRLSRGAAGAADSALTANLAVLRNAIDLYATEHGGTYPALATIEDQLIKYSDSNGNTSDTKAGDFIYGPYLRKVPALPIGVQKGSTDFFAGPADDAEENGWVYDQDTGTITANSEGSDEAGKPYSLY